MERKKCGAECESADGDDEMELRRMDQHRRQQQQQQEQKAVRHAAAADDAPLRSGKFSSFGFGGGGSGATSDVPDDDDVGHTGKTLFSSPRDRIEFAKFI